MSILHLFLSSVFFLCFFFNGSLVSVKCNQEETIMSVVNMELEDNTLSMITIVT